ncbi:MAG: glycosyltransferase family 4 protein [Coleofasciculus sp. C1-SOL-03]|uniref:glycosyltransferase family 4 protein n=1 Tax=Coleofasciculus sp. C1-SOL-03 TaxID=3069522 RepID=UPI0032FEDF75
MKILHITQGYSPAIGGTEWLIQRVSEELVQQFGDEVTVFTTNRYNGEGFFNPKLPRMPIGWEKINGVNVRRFPVYSHISQMFRRPQALAYRLRLPKNEYLRAISGGPIIPGLRQAIREFPADLIAASSFPLLHMFSALGSAQETGRPCVFYGGLHPEDDWGYQRPMIYRAIEQSTGYVAYTKFEADYVIQQGASPERVFVVGLGVDPEPFAQVSSDEAKQRLGFDHKPVVGFIGQLGGHKGVDTILKAMPIVWQVVPDAHLLIAGARTMFAARLEQLIQSWSKEEQDKITLHYNFSNEEKPALFAAVDVFAYPSGYESFGIAFLEAWAANKPVIGCRRGAVPWVIQAGKDGLLVDYQSEQMLAEAIIMLLTNPVWANQLAEFGRQKVRSRYTWSTVAKNFREVYVEASKRSQNLVN